MNTKLTTIVGLTNGQIQALYHSDMSEADLAEFELRRYYGVEGPAVVPVDRDAHSYTFLNGRCIKRAAL